ncbi:hypothetical protein Tco_0291643 [Tanacetum coccineum]
MIQALIDYDVRLDDVPIMCDNKGAIILSKNPVQQSRTKHIEIRDHFLRDNVQKGHISIEKVLSVDNIADILTKPLKRESFNYLPKEFKICSLGSTQSYVPTVVDSYLDTKVGDVFQKELQKHTTDLIHKYSLQHLPELTKKPTPTAEQESEKSPSKILKIKREQAESQKNP